MITITGISVRKFTFLCWCYSVSAFQHVSDAKVYTIWNYIFLFFNYFKSLWLYVTLIFFSFSFSFICTLVFFFLSLFKKNLYFQQNRPCFLIRHNVSLSAFVCVCTRVYAYMIMIVLTDHLFFPFFFSRDDPQSMSCWPFIC